jgi:aspartate racemase
LRKTRALAPDDALDSVGTAYREMAVRGRATDADRSLFVDAGAALIRAGADGVVLAGTDLNLVFDGLDPGYTVIDALDVHVGVLADLASGARDLT